MSAGQENDTPNMIYGEIDYLWSAMKLAQEESDRINSAFEHNKRDADALKLKAMRLERDLAESAKTERVLKHEIEGLRAKIESDSAVLKEALATAKDRAAMQERLNEAESRAAGAENILIFKEGQLAELRQRLDGSARVLKENEQMIEAMSFKIKGLMSLPEISAVIHRSGGKSAAIYVGLLEQLESNKAAVEKTSMELETLKASSAALSAEKRVLETETTELKETLANTERRIASLKSQLEMESGTSRITADENTDLKRRLSDMTARHEALKEELSAWKFNTEKSSQAARAKDAEISRLTAALDEAARRAEEQKHHFNEAVKEVFALQSAAAQLRKDLKHSREQLEELANILSHKKQELEKVGGLLKQAQSELKERNSSARQDAQDRHALEHSIEELKAKAEKAENYAALLLKKLEERDKYISSLKTETDKTAALEIELTDLRRHNVKLMGMIKVEQIQFADKLAKSIAKAAAAIKILERLPEETTSKARLVQPRKDLSSAMNMLKSWQTYMDDGDLETVTVDIKPALERAAAMWEKAFRAKKLAISARLVGHAYVDANIARLKMVFYQLIKNAYENLSAGGALRISMAPAGDHRSILIRFEDNGPGLPQSVIGKLFEPFNTAKKDHAGLGLALAERAASSHGGTFTVTNKKDKGLIAELKLPLSEDQGSQPLDFTQTA